MAVSVRTMDRKRVLMMGYSKVCGLVALACAATWFGYPKSREWPAVLAARAYVEKSFSAYGWTVPESVRVAKSGDAAAGAPKGGGKQAAPGGSRGGAPAVPVTAATAIVANMPVILSAPGTVEAFASAAVKPRVDGQVAAILFKEGDLVKEGQVLFRLDDRLMNTQIRQAEANIARDKAAIKDAEVILGRRESLVAKKIVTEAATDTQRSTVESLKAAIIAGQAQLDAQKTQLDYLTIKAPIGGRTGAIKAELGVNVRAADANPLVTINQIQPISVSFAVPQNDLAALRRAQSATAQATVTVPGEKPITVTGKITFVDNQVDKQTGTLTAKLEVDNKAEALWPGQAVDVALTVEQRAGLIAVPATAVQPSQIGMLAWVIGLDNKASPRPVKLERVVGDTAYVSDGLKADERVVTDGQLRLAPGSTVTVRDPNAPAAAPSGAPGAKKDGKDSGKKGPAAGVPNGQVRS